MTHIHVRAQQLRNTTQQAAQRTQQRSFPLTGEEEGPVAPGGQSRMVRIFIEGVPPSPNAVRRMHYHQRSDEANVWKDATVIELHRQTGGRWTRMDRVQIVLTLVTSTNRRQDPDNLAGACKPLVDGLVLAGLIPDDSFAVVEELVVRSEKGPTTGVRVEVLER